MTARASRTIPAAAGAHAPGPAVRTLTLDELVLESGARLSPVTVAYETFGRPDARSKSAILVCHALTGSAHVARRSSRDPEAGWWDGIVGPGRALDTNRHFIICSNVVGGCYGTTGPSSTNPATGRPFGMEFPVITIRDMVRLQHSLLRQLGINRLATVVGGSMGGMQALEWAVMYPDMVESIVPIAVSGRLSAQAIAYNHVQRRAILTDPGWRGGGYYGSPGPRDGLALARMIGTITYRSDACWSARFGRSTTPGGADPERPGGCFEIESYLSYQGEKMVDRFDANSYLYLSRAMDLHDLGRGRGAYEEIIGSIGCRVLAIGISSDILFPTRQQRELVQILRRAGRDARYAELESPHGHDAFLIEAPALSALLGKILPGLCAPAGRSAP